MYLRTLSLRDLRCHDDVQLALAPGLNLLSGDNGSGKTSVLEAVYLLSRTQSFRGSRPADLIRHDAEALVVAGEIHSGDDTTRVAVQRSRSGLSTRLGSERDVGLATLLRAVQVQLIDPRLHQLVEDGPAHRRRFLDWGVFHVEHAYLQAWQRYSRALRQRNAACRAGDARALEAYEPLFIESALAVHGLRVRHLESLTDTWKALCQAHAPDLDAPELRYRPGWPQSSDLGAALLEARSRELALGHTLHGPHRADFVVGCRGRQVKHQLSRGQQKLLIIALAAAQMACIADARGETPIMLLDDLASELGPDYQARVWALAESTGGQWLMTQLGAAEPPVPAQMLHVEHGRISPGQMAAGTRPAC